MTEKTKDEKANSWIPAYAGMAAKTKAGGHTGGRHICLTLHFTFSVGKPSFFTRACLLWDAPSLFLLYRMAGGVGEKPRYPKFRCGSTSWVNRSSWPI